MQQRRGNKTSIPLFLPLPLNHKKTKKKKKKRLTLVMSGEELCKASQDNNIDLVRRLLGAGADAKWRDGLLGSTALHEASSGEVAEVLLREGGADVGAANSFGSTPLHVAASRGSDPVAEVLLREGADVGAADEDGSTPLHLAAFRGRDSVAGTLLGRGAPVAARNNEGKTPEEVAEARGNHVTADIIRYVSKIRGFFAPIFF